MFWRLARECHPDSGTTVASETLFTQVRREYEEARRTLAAPRPAGGPGRAGDGAEGDESGPVYSADRCVEAFADLVASGFPIDPSLRPAPAGYARARERFLGLYSRRDPGAEERFLRFERELYEIRGDDIVMNPLFGKIKLILFNIPAAFFGGSFGRRAVKRWLADLQAGEPGTEHGSDAGWASPVRIGPEHYPSIIEFVETLAF